MLLKRLFFAVVIGLTLVSSAWAQSTETPTQDEATSAAPPRARRTKPAPRATPTPTPAAKAQDTAKPKATPAKTQAADEKSVRDTFAELVKSIEATDADAVDKIYWNSPQLLMFNRNGTITRGWEQMHANRVATYATVSEVKLTTRNVNVQMMGRDGAVLSCLWSQSQKNDGRLEAANGRMTLVFRRIKNEWKIIHLHTSPGDGNEVK
jgi:ketosteroid isomerase-like protein